MADAPWNFEQRLVRVRAPELKRLRVKVPEKHDLVLMKALRGYEHDIETAVAIHQTSGLVADTLLYRYLGEMDHVVGDPARLDMNILAVVECVFGGTVVEEAERRIRSHRRSRRG